MKVHGEICIFFFLTYMLYICMFSACCFFSENMCGTGPFKI